MLDWKEKTPVCEFSAKQKIRDACFLHNHNMFAVAQKKTINIYDQNGIELHCLKDHPDPFFLQFLPFHFLLSTITQYGQIKYLDISTGQLVSEIKTKKGEPSAFGQNPWNAVVAAGHVSGEVSMWIPNMGKAAVNILCHPSQRVNALAFHPQG